MDSSPANGNSSKSLKKKKKKRQVDNTYNNESIDDDKISSVGEKKEKKAILTKVWEAQNAHADRDEISPITEKKKPKEKVLTQDDSASKKVNKKLSNKNKMFNFETNETDIDLRKDCNNDEEINESHDLSKTPRKNNILENLENTENIETENIHLLETPKKNDISRDLESTNIKIENADTPIISRDLESANIKIENADTPIKSTTNLGIDSVEWHAQTEISSVSKKKRRRPYNESTPKKKIKKDLNSDINNYDQLFDIPKKELYKNELDDFEHIEMLHDSNSLINFQESTIFCSTDEIVPDQNIEISTDLKSDPLYITNNNVSIADGNIENEGTNTGNKIKKEREDKSSNTDVDSDIDYDCIKHVLGELDLDISLEDDEDELTEETTKVSIHIKIYYISHTLIILLT